MHAIHVPDVPTHYIRIKSVPFSTESIVSAQFETHEYFEAQLRHWNAMGNGVYVYSKATKEEYNKQESKNG